MEGLLGVVHPPHPGQVLSWSQMRRAVPLLAPRCRAAAQSHSPMAVCTAQRRSSLRACQGRIQTQIARSRCHKSHAVSGSPSLTSLLVPWTTLGVYRALGYAHQNSMFETQLVFLKALPSLLKQEVIFSS